MKLTVGSSFPIHPPRGGGQNRIFGLYGALARHGVAVDVVALVEHGARPGTREIAPGMREIRVAQTRAHAAAQAALHRRSGMPATDVALTVHHELTPAYAGAIAASAADSDAIVASHPYAQPALASASRAPLIYDSHNVEIDLKAAMTGDTQVLEAVRAVEAACCTTAQTVAVCSREDSHRLGELYGLDPASAVLVPNGVDPAAVAFTPPELRAAHKARLGLDGAFQAVFLGSWHEPNLAAVRHVVAAARQLPDVSFLVVGGAGLPFARRPLPDNVDVTGVVDAGFVAGVLAVADVALNPMSSGSGTNLKMLDYALAGIPLISTPFGTRGLAMRAGVHYMAAEADELAAAISALRLEDAAATAARVRAARDHVAGTFAWDAVAAPLHERLLRPAVAA